MTLLAFGYVLAYSLVLLNLYVVILKRTPLCLCVVALCCFAVWTYLNTLACGMGGGCSLGLDIGLGFERSFAFLGINFVYLLAPIILADLIVAISLYLKK